MYTRSRGRVTSRGLRGAHGVGTSGITGNTATRGAASVRGDRRGRPNYIEEPVTLDNTLNNSGPV